MIDEKKLIDNLIIRREKLRSIVIAIHHNNTSYADTIINEINNIIDIINEQPKVGEWIPCSERLPEDDLDVEVTIKDGLRDIGYYMHGCWRCRVSGLNIDVIAWKEPSEPWEGEE